MKSSPSPRPFPWVRAAVALAAVAGIGWLIRAYVRAPAEPVEPEPEPPFVSPYLNTKPGVKSVGDAACAECHPAQAETYRQHPMGRSLTPVRALAAVDEHIGNPFDALGLRYSVERRGASLVHAETARDAGGSVVAETTAPVDYVIGSGTHAYSYLVNRDGVLTQSPITWFRQKNAFDLSPGFGSRPEHFERPIIAGCLFCHANHVEPEPDALNRYRGSIFTGHAIGCERCHGPGELHAGPRQPPPLGEKDWTIVNPSALSPKLHDDVCNQCHLGGKERVVRRGKGTFDYRPGLPLEEYLRVFVLPDSGLRVAGHAEQMTASRCFTQSNGKMGCVSCHDPHRVPAAAEKEAYYRQRCLTCHEQKGCTEPLARRQEKRDDCAACHMPRAGSNIAHVALTDHRIPRRPDPAPPAAFDPVAAARSLIPFGGAAKGDPELPRDLAVGLVARARSGSDVLRREVARTWIPTLEKAIVAHEDDLPAREAFGVALAWVGNLDGALVACAATLARAERREMVLADAGLIAQRLGFNDKSFDYWQRALAINPHSSRYQFEVANGLVVRGDWSAAVTACRATLATNPGHVPSRLLLMQHYSLSGSKAQARAELTTVLALHPPNESELRQRFAEILR